MKIIINYTLITVMHVMCANISHSSNLKKTPHFQSSRRQKQFNKNLRVKNSLTSGLELKHEKILESVQKNHKKH